MVRQKRDAGKPRPGSFTCMSAARAGAGGAPPVKRKAQGGSGDLSAVARTAKAEPVPRRYKVMTRQRDGGLRGVYHRARVRATCWLIRPAACKVRIDLRRNNSQQ